MENKLMSQGWVARGFEPVREAFEENFVRYDEIGAAVSVYHRGNLVVDLWGGTSDLRMPNRQALGFALPHTGLPWWSPSSFGHAGHGGALGYADPETDVAFGYVTNRLNCINPDHRATALARAVRLAVGQRPGS